MSSSYVFSSNSPLSSIGVPKVSSSGVITSISSILVSSTSLFWFLLFSSIDSSSTVSLITSFMDFSTLVGVLRVGVPITSSELSNVSSLFFSSGFLISSSISSVIVGSSLTESFVFSSSAIVGSSFLAEDLFFISSDFLLIFSDSFFLSSSFLLDSLMSSSK